MEKKFTYDNILRCPSWEKYFISCLYTNYPFILNKKYQRPPTNQLLIKWKGIFLSVYIKIFVRNKFSIVAWFLLVHCKYKRFIGFRIPRLNSINVCDEFIAKQKKFIQTKEKVWKFYFWIVESLMRFHFSNIWSYLNNEQAHVHNFYLHVNNSNVDL